MPELTTVVSEIKPILSPKQAPPAMAQTVITGFPATMWFNHKKIGAQAAKVPQEVPVATERIDAIIKEVTATVFAVIPSPKAKLIIAAPTPVAINASAIA